MAHSTPLLGTIVAGLVVAFITGAVAHHLRVSPVAGYLFAGVPVGPFTHGFDAGAIAVRVRSLKPGTAIVAREHSGAEVEHSKALGVQHVIMGEQEIGRKLLLLMDRTRTQGPTIATH